MVTNTWSLALARKKRNHSGSSRTLQWRQAGCPPTGPVAPSGELWDEDAAHKLVGNYETSLALSLDTRATYPLTKANRSGLIVSGWVVHMPCARPG
jgi:hypothetical protein